jgi:hypothetical protein
VPWVYLTPFVAYFDIDVLAARAYFAVIKRSTMKIFATGLTKLISPLRIAVVSKDGRDEEQDRKDVHGCLRGGLQIA